MKRIFAIFALLLTLAVPAFAKPVTMTGCTADKHAVSLSLEVFKNTPDKIVKEIDAAFKKTAAALAASDLADGTGFGLFVTNLSEEDYEAIESLSGPPVVTGTCK